MTKEELLRPRYKIIVDYPFCPFEVGTILYAAEDGELYSDVAGYSPSKWIVRESQIQQWPHLFQLLQWWEHRDMKDMPEYIKYIKTGEVIKYDDKLKVHGTGWMEGEKLLPATLSDYEQYQSQCRKI